MAGDDDLKDHAINSSHDFYALLDLQPAASESEIRRAYRRTALKYHPDKVGPNDSAALEKFHLLQIAYDVLLDPGVRQLYDNARRAREEKKDREAAYEGRRRQLKEELERRESAAASGFKRKREEESEEAIFQRELKRLAEDGARRRREREDQLRHEAQEELRREQNGHHDVLSQAASVSATSQQTSRESTGVDEADRTITLRFPVNGSVSDSGPGVINREELTARFSRFGKIDEVVLGSNKKIKVKGEKHRREYTTAIIVFHSIVGAHAAVTDVPELAKSEALNNHPQPIWSLFEAVGWAAGKEPDCLPKPVTPIGKTTQHVNTTDTNADSLPSTPIVQTTGKVSMDGGLKKVPSFGSFKGFNSPMSSTRTPERNARGVGSPSMEELTMIRLKNAERRRLAEKLRKEDAEAEAAQGI